MAYDDGASRRSYGSRNPRYGDRGTAAEYYASDRSGGGSGRHARSSYYEPDAPLADNSQLARRSQLPAAYYQEPDRSVRSGRSGRSGRDYSRSRSRSRSTTPPKRTSTRRGDLISAAAGAIALTAADKFLIEPRMKHGRSKSHHETLRRVADVGVGGAAGTAIYRAVSRSRARKKGALADSRPGSPDSRRGGRSRSRGRGRSESRGGSGSRERSKSQLPWKSLLGTAGGAIAGLAAEHFKNRGDSQKGGDRDGGRSKSRRRDDSDSDSDYSSRKPRRHRSADDYDDRRSKGGRDRGFSDEDDAEDDRRHRSSRRKSRGNKDSGGGETPHQGRDLVQEAIGLIGVAQGLRGHNKKQAAVETAIGAAGLAQNYYERQKKNKQAAAR